MGHATRTTTRVVVLMSFGERAMCEETTGACDTNTKHGLKTSIPRAPFHRKSLCFLTNRIPVFNHCIV